MVQVFRCVQDYDDVFRNLEAEFPTEAEAEAYVGSNSHNTFSDVWYEIDFD